MAVTHRSVSQYQQYTRCPYSYYLTRVAQEWQRPAAWLPQGLAVHEAAEVYEMSGRMMDLDEAQEVFRDSYAKHTNRLAEDTPNFDFWFASGPYRGEQDIERRFGLGLDQVERYLDYYTSTAPDEKIWTTPDGTPAIELPFSIDLDGVEVKGFIDQVIASPDHPFPRDIKTGNKPGDDFQLAVYALALLMVYGVEVSVGDYWMGRKGKPTVPYKLDQWTKESIAAEFKQVDDGIRSESFEPDPEPSKCRFCSVASSCAFSAA